ncbi:hypothetical protein PR202_gb08083 [Eleusine coracana subsp. coracana]|uniref:BTB domain-containing protein n=1 Tax=Eleusine coracana subsp. coracana TaxID=191504 RepID=A0AAV5EEN0_ELECO|nr:hypothetical protein PR202_gb08083 [Eleusine coracana subsp. coracana]
MAAPVSSLTASEECITTRSAIVAGNLTGHHLLDIEGYSVTKELLPCVNCMDSRRFKFGGRLWYICYYPKSIFNGVHADFISIYLFLVEGIDKPVKAVVTYSLLDQAGKPVPSHIITTGVYKYYTQYFGLHQFIKREFLEKSDHIKNDRFTIRCDITIKKLEAEERTALPASVDVPPSDLHQHLGNLLVTKEGADVTFQVTGESFRAHRNILASRSPVFKAELFGAMRERAMRRLS